MSDRRRMLAEVSRALGRRDLIWGGLRADDIEGLSDLPQLAGSFSIIGGHDRGGAVPSLLDYEDLSGVRTDLDAWDIEEHLDEEPAIEFREALLARLASPTALLPYRSSAFLSSVLFARRDRCLDLGRFGAQQVLFEHKPWVETQVAALGVPRVPWVYVADEEQFIVRQMLTEGPVMLRVSRSSGGAGVVRVDDAAQIGVQWPHRSEGFVAVAPYLDGALPVNIGATVWHDGVTMQHPSIQLIGIPGCTTRPFGFCGNDFGAASDIDENVLDGIEESVTRIGNWLRRYDYTGTLGVDFLVHRGEPLFTEINARFQGSTHASSQLSSGAAESCLYLDHIAAVLGLDAPRRPRLRDRVSSDAPFAHLVVHWTGRTGTLDVGGLVHDFSTRAGVCRVDVVAKPAVVTEPGGVAARVTTKQPMTTTGFDLIEPWASCVAAWKTGGSAGHNF